MQAMKLDTNIAAIVPASDIAPIIGTINGSAESIADTIFDLPAVPQAHHMGGLAALLFPELADDETDMDTLAHRFEAGLRLARVYMQLQALPCEEAIEKTAALMTTVNSIL